MTISDRFDYPNLRTFGTNNGRLDFTQDVTAASVVVDANTILSITTNYDVDGIVLIGSNQSGTSSFDVYDAHGSHANGTRQESGRVV